MMIDSFYKLPMGKYLELLEIDKDGSLSEIDKQAEILAVLNDTTAEEIMELPIVEYKAMAAASDFLHKPVPAVNYNHLAKSYTLGGWELTPTTDIRKVTASQYVDFQTFSKQGEGKIIEMLSCFLIPKGKSYADGYDVVELQRILRECLTVADVVTLSAFFLMRYAKSIRRMRIYCKRMMRKLRLRLTPEQRTGMWEREEAMMADLAKSGDGLPQWMQ